jgi:hypothetical protein
MVEPVLYFLHLRTGSGVLLRHFSHKRPEEVKIDIFLQKLFVREMSQTPYIHCKRITIVAFPLVLGNHIIARRDGRSARWIVLTSARDTEIDEIVSDWFLGPTE